MLGQLTAGRRSARENGRMRPGNQSNKRMRGRGRKGPNPLTRTYESNGPDVKIRGTAMHVAEKYQQLARDAQASGDRVMFESYNQHAEHYLRIVAAAQPQQPVAQPSARSDADDGYEHGSVNGSGGSNNGSDRQAADSGSQDNDLLDADSPQPYIEDMPVIDQEGQVNGSGHKADADSSEGDDKPRRRARTPRTRAPRRAAAEASSDAVADPGDGGSTESAAGGDDDQPKPRRKTTRARRTKPAEEAVAASE